ncbi:MAG: HU family DNA-binding protein [Deltaproteobacteria bacterium]|nr:HU family DNA-binding protein [Deltaproteobacteria bacterium]
MTKAELVEQMAKDAGISKAAAGEALGSFMATVTKALKKKNGKVTLVGFGTFKKVYRKTRKGPRMSLNFQPGKNCWIPFKTNHALPAAHIFFEKEPSGIVRGQFRMAFFIAVGTQ